MAGSEQDGIDGADRRSLRGRGVGAHPDRRPPTTAPSTALRSVIAELGADVVVAGARPPRRAGGGRLARSAPHRGVADAAGRRSSRRAPRPAAAGGRRLPRHDAHRVRPPRHLARHLRREPHRHRRRARRPARVARRGARHRGRRRPRRAAVGARAGAHAPAPTCPSRLTSAGDLCEVRVPVPDRAGVLAEVTTLAGTLDVNIADLEIAHSSEGEQGVLILLVEAGAAERLRGGLVGAGLPPLGHPAGVADGPARPAADRHPRRSARRRRRRCPGRRASPTGPWCARPSPTARAPSPTRCTPTTPRRWSTGSVRSAPRSTRDWAAGRLVVDGHGRAARSATWRSSTPGSRAPPAGSCSPSPASGRGTGASTRPTACASARWARCSTRCAPSGREVHEVGAPGHLPVEVDRRAPWPAARWRCAATCPASSSPGCCSPARPCATGLVARLVGDLVSQPYVDITVAVMASFGVRRRAPGRAAPGCVAPQAYVGRPTYAVEPDASAASYVFAAAALLGGRATVAGLGESSLQGDLAFVDVLEQMGATVERSRDDHDRHRHRAAARRRGRHEPALRHRPDPRRGGRVRRRPDAGDRASGSSAARRPIGSATWSPSSGGSGVDADEEPDGFVVRPGADARRDRADLRRPPHGDGLRARRPAVRRRPDRRPRLRGQDVPGLLATSSTSCGAPSTDGRYGPARHEGHRHRRAGGLGQVDGGQGAGGSAWASSTSTPARCTARSPSRPCAAASIRRRPSRSLGSSTDIELESGADGVTVDGVDATIEIRGPEVSRAVSIVAANPAVRAEMVRRQREWVAARDGGVLEGRDIGTVVFPDADLKVYLTADPEVRAQRRSKEVTDLDYETVAADLARRDALGPGPGACRRSSRPTMRSSLDTTGMSVEEIIDTIAAELARDRRLAEARPGDDVEIWTGAPSRTHADRLRHRARAHPARGQGPRSGRRSSAPRTSRPPVPSSSRRCTAATSTSPSPRSSPRRPMRYMGKDCIWKSKPLGRFVSMLGAFPVHRGSADRDALQGLHRHRQRGQPARDVPRGHPSERTDRAGDVRRHRLRGGQGRRADHPDGHRRAARR